MTTYSRKIWSRLGYISTYIMIILMHRLRYWTYRITSYWGSYTSFELEGTVGLKTQDNICIQEKNVRVNTKSALGWSGLTGSSKSVVQMYNGVNKITSLAVHIDSTMTYKGDTLYSLSPQRPHPMHLLSIPLLDAKRRQFPIAMHPGWHPPTSAPVLWQPPLRHRLYPNIHPPTRGDRSR